MRCIEGTNLRTVLGERGRLEPDEALLIVGQAAEALDAAHGQGLVHRDVNPANVLIERAVDGGQHHVYLADFGLTKHVPSQTGLALTGEFVGTVDYIAPEQIRDKRVDARADVYSLGCVLYQCLTGRVLFPKAVAADVLWAHLQESSSRRARSVLSSHV